MNDNGTKDTEREDEDGETEHVGHVLRFTGAWFCDTCNSPYCDLA